MKCWAGLQSEGADKHDHQSEKTLMDDLSNKDVCPDLIRRVAIMISDKLLRWLKLTVTNEFETDVNVLIGRRGEANVPALRAARDLT